MMTGSLVAGTDPQAAATTLNLIIYGVGGVVSLVVYCWYAAALGSVFVKMGGSKVTAWVPVVNQVQVFVRAGQSGWLFLLMPVPVVGLVVWARALHKINTSFGRGAFYTVLALLLPPVWASLLGWGSDHPDFEPRRLQPSTSAAGGRGPLAEPEFVPVWAGPPVAATTPLPPEQPWAPAETSAPGQTFEPAAQASPLPPDPFAPVLPGIDAYGQPVAQADPFAQPAMAGLDPYGQPVAPADPFAQPAMPGPLDPYGQPVAFSEPAAPAAPGGPFASGSPADGGQPWPQPAGWPPEPVPFGRSGPPSPPAADFAASEPLPELAPPPVVDLSAFGPPAAPDPVFGTPEPVVVPPAPEPTPEVPEPVLAVPETPEPVALGVPETVVPDAAVPDAVVPQAVAPDAAVPATPEPAAAVPAPEPTSAPAVPVLPSSLLAEDAPAPQEPAPVADAPSAPQASVPGDAQPTLVMRMHQDDDIDGTVIVQRPAFRPWVLSLDDGRTFVVQSRTVVIGRRPECSELGVQMLTITDDGRTISKTHARLDLVEDTWHVADLGSTNGVVATDEAGDEVDVEPGKPMPVYGHLVLGAVGMRLTPGGGPV